MLLSICKWRISRDHHCLEAQDLRIWKTKTSRKLWRPSHVPNICSIDILQISTCRTQTYSHCLDPFGITFSLSNFKVSRNHLEFIIPPRSHLLSIFSQEQRTLWPDSLRAPMTKAESFRTRHSKAMKPAKIRSFSASHISATDAIGFGWVEWRSWALQ